MANISTAFLVRRIRLLLNEQLNVIEVQEVLDQVVRERFIGHTWSFAKDDLAFNTVAEVTTGTVAITQGDTAVVGTGTAFSTSNDVGKIFHGPDGESYEISAVTDTTNLTLASAYAGEDVTAGSYSIRQAVYTLDANVEQVLVMGSDEWQMYEITDSLLTAVDVDRQITGPPWYWRYVDPDSSGSLRVELHPTPTEIQRVPYVGLLKADASSVDQSENFSHLLMGVLINGAADLGATVVAARQDDATQIRKWQNQSEVYRGRFALMYAELRRRDLSLFGRDETPYGLEWAYRDDPGIDLGPWYQ